MNNNYIWKENIELLRELPKGSPFVFMYSGGKDTGLALSIAIEQGIPFELIHCIDKENEESLFHEQKKEVMNAQALQLGIPIKYVSYKWWVRWDKMVKLFMDYKKLGVKYVVYGDLNSEGNVDVQIKLCKSAGLLPCFPLLFIPYEKLIDEIEKRKIKSIITTINHGSIKSKWLGKAFDKSVYETFCNFDIDPFGEGGEYHTTLVDADCFKESLQYTFVKADKRKIIININE